MPAKDKSNNNSNNSHSTLDPLPPFQPPALAHRIALSASGVALRCVVVVAVVAAFLLATRKKSNKNNCHSPPHPTPPSPSSSCRLAQHKRLAHLPPTHLTLSQSAQLNSPHLTQKPNPTHPTPILHSQYPRRPPRRTSHAQCLPNHSQNSALSCLSTHLPPPSALATADSHSLLPFLLLVLALVAALVR